MAAATGAVAEVTVEEQVVPVPAPVEAREAVVLRAVTAASALRRKTFSTSRSIWTSALLSSSTVDVKVRHDMAFPRVPSTSSPKAPCKADTNPSLVFDTTVTGTLKGYDALMNLVLDDVQEAVRGKLLPPLPFSARCISFSVAPVGPNPCTYNRRRRQRNHPSSRTCCCARYAPRCDQPRRRKRGDCEPLRSAGGGSLSRREYSSGQSKTASFQNIIPTWESERHPVMLANRAIPQMDETTILTKEKRGRTVRRNARIETW